MANSCLESLETEDCQKLKKVLRKWNLLTCLIYQFPKCLLLANIQAGYWAGIQPLLFCHWTHVLQNEAGIILQLGSLDPDTAISTSGWLRQVERRFTQSSRASLTKIRPAAPSSAQSSAGAIDSLIAGKAPRLAALYKIHTELQCAQV